jgi:hypothetical protein
MKPGFRSTCTALISLVASLFLTIPALAVPQLPSSFYGTVKVNNANVTDGTSVEAIISGQVYAEAVTQSYQGDSVYTLDVRGDDSDTSAQDGGRAGDTIQFRIGGVLADQTATWHSGTNVNLNLTAAASAPVATPQATLTPVPTQTPIPTRKPTRVPATFTPTASIDTTPVLAAQEPTTTGFGSPLVTNTVRSQSATQTPKSLASPTKHKKPTKTSVTIPTPQVNGTGNYRIVTIPILAAGFVIVGVGCYFIFIRKKKV